MAANTTPIFTITPKVGMVQVSVANTNRDGTGTLGTVITGATNGTRINRIDIVAIVTTTAGMVRLFISDGTNHRLWKEVPVTAITPSATVAAFSGSVVPTEPLILPSGYSLRASTHNAETFNVIAHAGDY
jgi:hypothetical protein